eukprot:CAMPEP_0168553958 /NCGR_PEP_ID=MMETSP0413-20121227/7524_1 /TAXON_ID=136452 /ORGANISM="Filamoeba nolandi, Strain NC-AS-23-1" /LENGTH=99 /DNA_ID=CAMNT_0008584667 /DNA_START=164 /DNA_END=460 /DNA_ORIENTATION=-
MEEIDNIVHDCYYPCLRLISYSLLQDGNVILYSHAHVGLETVKALATHYSVAYDDSTAEKLCHTIEAIHACFQPAHCSDITPRMEETNGKWHETEPSDP